MHGGLQKHCEQKFRCLYGEQNRLNTNHHPNVFLYNGLSGHFGGGKKRQTTVHLVLSYKKAISNRHKKEKDLN